MVQKQTAYQARVDHLAEYAQGEGRQIETVVAFHSHDEVEDGVTTPMWLFRSESVSPMFLQAFGANWHYRVYSYDTWKDVLERINEMGTRRPKRIELDLTYRWESEKGRLQIGVWFNEIRVNELSMDFLLEEIDTPPTAK